MAMLVDCLHPTSFILEMRSINSFCRCVLLLLLTAIAPASFAAEAIPAPTAATADSLESAVSTGPSERILPGVRTRLRLDATSPSVRYESYLTYYKVFEVVAPADGALSLQLESFCACLGFDKKIGVPVVAVFDAQGARVPTPEVVGVEPGFGLMNLVGHFDAHEGQTYRIVVMTDNSQLGSIVQVVNIGTTTGSTVASLPSRSTPGGKMRLTIGGKQK